MPLPTPNLDDRNFNQLMDEARRQIAQSSPNWTDLSPSDPGVVLLELFAHLTETMLYRLNRLPQKAYVEFLRLLGVRLQPPAAARVELTFSRSRTDDKSIEIPRGTRVTLNRAGSGSEPPVFVTSHTITIPAGGSQSQVLAHHCDLIEAELAGYGTGLPGLSLTARLPPIIASTGDELDLLVGVEAVPSELGERAPAIQYSNKAYRVWREVENFTNLDPNDLFVYVADRMTGAIVFAPAARMSQANGDISETAQALAAIPPAGREIRVWYRRGGGPAGNVAANTLTTLKDPIAGILVTNANPATGGRSAETVENALIRGPQQLHSLQRAVTARDFELAALYSSRAIARAKALTRAAIWSYAKPGTVEVLLVPYLPEDQRGAGQVTSVALHQQDTEEARSQIQTALDERRPLGIACIVNWARYKTVRVTARIVVRREENPLAVKQRVIDRLYQTINPLPTSINGAGWPFGQALRASNVYDIALAEPGVRWVDRVKLLVDEVPENDVAAIAVDSTQSHTWYAGSGPILFRSLNDGDGWEPAGLFENEVIDRVRAHPTRAGLIAVLTHLPDASGARLHVSHDCGETWGTSVYSFAFRVADIAWTTRDDTPYLLLATDVGLYELPVREEGSPVQILVDPAAQNQGFYAVVVANNVRGGVSVAVAAQNTGGIYLSSQGGVTQTFRKIGQQGQDIRELAVQVVGPRAFLWAGTASAGGDDLGKGCFSWELLGTENPPEGWRAFGQGWIGGTVRELAFMGTKVLAASHRAGVLQIDPNATNAVWQVPSVTCGLPMRDAGRFHPVATIATDPAEQLILAGGSHGTVSSRDVGITYTSCSSKEFIEKVTLPETWLFVSGEHDINVVSEDEAK